MVARGGAGGAAAAAPSVLGVVASVNKAAAARSLVRCRRREDGQWRLVDARGEEVAGPAGHARRAEQPFPGMDCFVVDGALSEAECACLSDCAERMGLTFWDSRGADYSPPPPPPPVDGDSDADGAGSAAGTAAGTAAAAEGGESEAAARAGTPRDFRNADTVEVHDAELAELLWERLRSAFEVSVHVPDEDDGTERWQRDLVGAWDPVGTNAHVLLARYKAGGHFAPHTDGYAVVDCDERSMFSIVLFLNSCEAGGGTRFYCDEQKGRLVRDAAGRFTGRPELVRATVEPLAGRMSVFFHQIMHEGVPVGAGCRKDIIRSDVMYRRRDPVCKTAQDREAFELYQRAQELSSDGATDDAMRLFRRAFKMSATLASVYKM